MTPGHPFSLQGLTFSVLGSTGTHLWDHPGAPQRPCGTTLAHLRNQTRKKRRIFTALGLTFDVLGDPGGHFLDHPGAPERPFETTLAHLRNQTPKKR